MFTRQLLLIFFIALFLPDLGLGQEYRVDSHIQNYSTDNGLPSNGIKGLQYDESTGFLWMATEAGIVRFNGVDFTSYTQDNMRGIQSERMMFITRSQDGKIFIADMPGNVFTIQEGNPIEHWRPKTAANPFYDNYYLFSVSEKLFHSLHPYRERNKFSIITNPIAALDDTSCLMLKNGRAYYMSNSVVEPQSCLSDLDSILFIFKISNHCFITTTNGTTFLYNNNRLQPVNVKDEKGNSFNINSKKLRRYWEMGMKSPVIIDSSYAFLFSFIGNTITAHRAFSGLPTGVFIRSVHFSEKNNQLFIGTDSRGLIIVNRLRVFPMKREGSKSNTRNSYYSQIELEDGSILTNEGDIIGKKANKIKLPIDGSFAYNIHISSDSVLWYSQVNKSLGYFCLHAYNYKDGTTRVFPKINSNDYVTELNHKMYVTNNKGIGIIEQDSLKYLYRSKNELFGHGIFDIGPLSPTQLYIATCDGLLRFNIRSNRLDTLFRKNSTCVRTVWRYNGHLFIGTYGAGIYIMKNDKIKQMPLDKNRFLRYAHCFVPDDKGYCWISTNRGLFKASINDLITAYEKNSPQLYYHYLGKNDGMDITEMNGGCTPCALKMKNKSISFPTMDGLLWVDPLKANILLPEGNIYIDEIICGNQKLLLDSSFTLNLRSNQRDLEFKLGFSAWCNKENIYLNYQLNDGEWKPVNTENAAMISFNNLIPGNYNLKIRKLNGFGENNYSYKEVRFSIQKPWNQQWWFYILLLLTMWGIISLYLRYRTRQFQESQRKLEQQVADKTRELKEHNDILEKNNSIKSRLISIISHDIITPLKFITVAGNNLVGKHSMMPEDLQQETIKEMTNTARELQFLSTNILNWIKYQNENRLMAKETFNVSEMVNQVIGLLNSLAKQKKLLLENRVHEMLTVYQYYEPLKILIYNLLTNAIHFTEKGKIAVEVETDKEYLTLIVSDEGVGMTPEQVQRILADQVVITSANVDNKKGHGLGYLIIKDLVKTMNATLEIKSKKEKGTTVKVRIPSQG